MPEVVADSEPAHAYVSPNSSQPVAGSSAVTENTGYEPLQNIVYR